MKKILSILLSIAICMSSCSIVYGADDVVIDAVEDTVIDTAPDEIEWSEPDDEVIAADVPDPAENDACEDGTGEPAAASDPEMEIETFSVDSYNASSVEEAVELPEDPEIVGTPEEIVDSGSCGDNVTWTLDSEGILTISGTGAMWDWGPSKDPSTSPWSGNNSDIKSVVIEKGITLIGDWAFYGSSLTNITIPDSVTAIGNYALGGCLKLTNITLPDSIKTIGSDAFYYCYKLESIDIPDSVTSIGTFAFNHCDALKSITLGSGLTNIADYTFPNCKNLANVVVPDGVRSIGRSAFEACNNLESIVIPDSVTSIGENAFHYYIKSCQVLPKLTIYGYTNSAAWTYARNNGIPFKEIDDEPVSSGKCGSNLTWSLNQEGTLTISGTGEMDHYGISVVLGQGNACYTEAPWGSLWVSRRVDTKKVIISDGVTSIGKNAFAFMHGLSEIQLPERLSSIHESAFWNCVSLSEVLIPSNVAYIASDAFFGNDGQPLGITIKCYSGSAAHTYALENHIAFTLLEGPVASGQCGETLFWSLDSEGNFTITGSGEMYTRYSTRDPDTLEYIEEVPWSQQYSRYIKKVSIEEGLVNLAPGMFYGCENLTKVTLPNTLQSIGDNAFCRCSALTELTIPDSVNDINDGAFYRCSSLKAVTLPKKLKHIGGVVSGEGGDGGSGIFGYCTSLKEIELPDGLTTIAPRTFYMCSNLEKIVIPKSVTSIMTGAFEGCDQITIYGYKESYAEEYAAENYIPFVSLGVSKDDENACNLLYRTINFSTPHGKKDTHKEIAVRFGFSIFNTDATQCGYKSDLAQAGLALSAAIENSFEECEQVFAKFNFKEMEHREGTDLSLYTPGICLGYRKVDYNGSDKYVVGVCLRGTTTTGDILTDGASAVNGFRPAGEFAYEQLKQYIGRKIPNANKDNLILFITGHSYGAATANVLTQFVDYYSLADMRHTFSYVFAPPRHDTGITSSSFSNLYNIINEDDIVCAIPRNKGHSGRILSYNYRKADNSFDTNYITLTEGAPSYTAVMSGKWDEFSDYLPHGLISNLWKSEIFCIVGDYYAAFSHSPDTYMAFLLSDQPSQEVFKKFRIAAVKCPVDISVSSADGKWLGSVKGNRPSYAEATEIIFFIDHDDKYIYMPYGDDYHITLTGTAEGSMEYTVSESDAVGNEEKVVSSFEHVALSNGKTMETSAAPKDGDSSIRLLVLNSSGAAVKEVRKDGTEVSLDPVAGRKYTIGKGKYSYNGDGTVTLVGTTSKSLTSFRIPKSVKINGQTCKVTSVGAAAFKNHKRLKKITLGANVSSIGKKAFSGCKALTTVKGGSSVTAIGAYAFYKCSALKKFTVSAKVSKIGKRAFYGCSGMTKLTIKSKKLKKSSVGSGAFRKTPDNMKVKVPASKKKTYTKILTAKGVSKKAKISG